MSTITGILTEALSGTSAREDIQGPAMTLDAVQEMANKLKAQHPVTRNPPTFMGVTVIENPALPSEEPVIQVMDHVPMTPEGRARINANLLRLFGTRSRVYYVRGLLMAHPKVVARLRYHASKDSAPVFGGAINAP